MASVNKVTLIGNLGRDPEIRYSQQGLAVCNFSIATTDYWTDKNSGERQEQTEWHRIVAFGKQAETLEKYLSKGSQVYVEGKLQTRKWEKDGQDHYTTEIVVSNFQFLGGKGEQGQQQSQSQPKQQDNQAQSQGHQGQGPIPDDDIPF